MGRLLKFELRKLFTQKSTYILFGIMAGLSVLSVVVSNFSIIAVAMAEISGNKDATFAALNTLGSANFEIIVGIFVAMFVCADYDLMTNKNVLSRGFTKSEIYFAKLIVVYAVVIVELIALFAINFFVGWLTMGLKTNQDFGAFFAKISVLFVIALAETAMFFAISILLRKTGGSIALNIVTPIAVLLVFMLFDSLAKFEDFALAEYSFSMMQTNILMSPDFTKLPVYAVVCAGYAAVFLVASYFATVKRD